MRDYSLTHVRDEVLLRDLAALVIQDRLTTATLLAHIAEVDARRLYVPAGYSSMHAYCVEELRLSEDAAYKRIQAARAARQFPAVFEALAEGRLHLAAVCLLAPHLTQANAAELIEAATHRRKSEVEEWLARSFPLPEGSARVRAIPAVSAIPAEGGADGFSIAQLAPGQVGCGFPAGIDATAEQLAPGQVGDVLTETGAASPERYLLQLTVPKSTRDKLRYAQALLSHAVPSGEVAQVLDRALDALISKLEQRKFGAVGGRPRRQRTARGEGRKAQQRVSVRKRHVPAQVRRAVWERDQGQCTFVSSSGVRCGTRRFLEFDHVDPVARGGRATVDRMRLRCRAHNQHEAERAFGKEYMARRRHGARLATAEARTLAHAREARTRAETRAETREARTRATERVTALATARATPLAPERAAAQDQVQDVLAGLRGLGCRADEARRAVECSDAPQDATLEERMRAALKSLSRRPIQRRAPAEAFHP